MESARSALTAYQPFDPREAGFCRRMLDLLEAPSPDYDCTSRHRFEPGHFTASAFVVSPNEDSLLLIFHKKLGIWVQPGGHVEPTDQSFAEAARREVAEELGLVLPEEPSATIFDVDIHAIPARKDEPSHEHFDVRYRFRSPTLQFVQTPEVADARWVPLADLATLTSDESVLRAARKLVPSGAAR